MSVESLVQEIKALIGKIRSVTQSIQPLIGYLPGPAKEAVNFQLQYQTQLLNPTMIEMLTGPQSLANPVADPVNDGRIQWMRYAQQHLNILETAYKVAQTQSSLGQWNRPSSGGARSDQASNPFGNQFENYREQLQRGWNQWNNMWGNIKREQTRNDSRWVSVLGGHGCLLCDVQPCPCLCFSQDIRGALCSKCGHLGH